MKLLKLLHQPGCSGYIESIPDHLDPDITADA